MESEQFGTFYIKHIDVFDSEDIDEKNEEYFVYAKDKGLPTEKEKLKQLEEDGIWGKEKQKEIDDLVDYIKRLKINKSKFFLKAQIDSVAEQIKNEEENLHKILSEKIENVGLTAENFAAKKINEYYIFKTLYKDKKFENRLLQKKSMMNYQNQILFI